MKVIGLALFGGSHLSTHDAEKFGFPVIEDAEKVIEDAENKISRT